MIVFKLGFVVGLLLASPVLIYQAWAFLSPALYDRERKVIFPALVVGLGLFLVGASLGYIFVVPQALRVFFSFQAESLQPMITYDAWFGFVLQIVLALGLSFELPLVIIILAALGVVDAGGTAPLPPLRGRAVVRGGRRAVARRRRVLDADDDGSRCCCCTRSGWRGRR